jgi:multidrug efflux pump subunit AcrA (membrane-fusion protein)
VAGERAAVVDRVAPAGDPTSRTFQVELILDNTDGRLRSGMFARAIFARGSRPALMVPAAALIRRGGLTGVYVVDGDGRARLRWLGLGRPQGDAVEALSGLTPGEAVVLGPPLGLADGVPVRAH